VSFPTLVGLGVAPVNANVTNTVALVPGYLGGSWAQRDELIPQLEKARALSVVSAAGGLAGSVLLLTIPGHAFRAAVPYLILLSCLLLLGQNRVRRLLTNEPGHRPASRLQARSAVGSADPTGVDAGSDTGAVAPELSASTQHAGRPGVRPALTIGVFAGAVYGGFFGAGLGIMLLAILSVFGSGGLTASNALKQALSFIINLVAAVFFAFSGHVEWGLAGVMAAASIGGGVLGGRLVSRVSGDLFRGLVIAAGVGAAVAFWVA